MDQPESQPDVSMILPRPWPKSSSMMVKAGIILGAVYLFISLLFPTVDLIYPRAVKDLVFMNFIKKSSNLTHPESFGVDRVSNFYLMVEPNVRLGIWHFRSPLVEDQSFHTDEEYFENHLASTPSTVPILIYLHGNAFDRSLVHRRELCEKLRDELKYDVITFDYRGFGDSTGKPTEAGIVQDAHFVYEWAERLTRGQRRIYLWGHSLGAAVACQLAARLSNETSHSLAGLIMEAPFLDIHQALLTHWFSLFFRWQPWFSGLAERALRRNDLKFNTREHLLRLNCPCVILHADDDLTIPYIHSKQLVQIGMAAREHHRQKKTSLHFRMDMISYHRAGYGHRLIYQAPKLIPALKRVIFEENL